MDTLIRPKMLDSKELKKLDDLRSPPKWLFKFYLRASRVINSFPSFAEDIQSETETNGYMALELTG